MEALLTASEQGNTEELINALATVTKPIANTSKNISPLVGK